MLQIAVCTRREKASRWNCMCQRPQHGHRSQGIGHRTPQGIACNTCSNATTSTVGILKFRHTECVVAIAHAGWLAYLTGRKANSTLKEANYYGLRSHKVLQAATTTRKQRVQGPHGPHGEKAKHSHRNVFTWGSDDGRGGILACNYVT